MYLQALAAVLLLSLVNLSREESESEASCTWQYMNLLGILTRKKGGLRSPRVTLS